MRFALAALLFAATPSQETKLDDVLDMMEKRAEGLRDLTFKVRNHPNRNWGMTSTDVSVLYVRGAGLRVRARAVSPADSIAMLGMAAPSTADFIYTADRLRLIQEWEHSAKGNP